MQYTLNDFLNGEQLDSAYQLYQLCQQSGDTFAERCRKLLEPIMPEVNQRCGREVDAGWLAYTCEYVFGEITKCQNH